MEPTMFLFLLTWKALHRVRRPACTRLFSCRKQVQRRAVWNPGGTPSKKDLRGEPRKSFVFMVPGDGFEPSTSGSTIQRSNQLSYPGNVTVAASVSHVMPPHDTGQGKVEV